MTTYNNLPIAEAYSADEMRTIRLKYQQILRASKIDDPIKRQKIKKAFDFALDAHKGMRRKSGEPYVLHPLEVAHICVKDIGLKTTSIICAFLHDVAEDTNYTIKDIEVMFGKRVAKIVDGLTKISGIFSQSDSLQAENFRKILLTLAEDVRVILIKLADRLHNMRTLESMTIEKQMKISSETSMLYAPLAHRLGLFSIKSEMEDLVLKYKNPDAFRIITQKLESSHIDRNRFIQSFIQPIKRNLTTEGLSFQILHRDKSISSIWQKMQTKKVDFEQVYDLFAVRIILNSEIKNEKIDCWRTYSSITDIYIPKQDRFRDWISVPKANGYEALHTTVMSKSGRWVEVQIRSNRMDEIAEKGYAAHWKYKGKTKSETGLDEWLSKIREILQNNDSNALDFLDDFKLNLFSDEIYLFTPKGEIRTLPKNSSVIDFAYSIHSHIGSQAIGAKINNQLVPLNHILNSGDQIEILTSAKQKPKDEWMNFAITARAKSGIKNSLKAHRKEVIREGKNLMTQYCKTLDLKCSEQFRADLVKFIGIGSESDFFYRLGSGQVKEDDIKQFVKYSKEQHSWMRYINPFSRLGKSEKSSLAEEVRNQLKKQPDVLLLSKKYDKADIIYAPCCNAIPGDDVIGFIEKDNSISIHRTTCSLANDLMSKYGNNIIKVKWREKGNLQFLTGIRMYGNDKLGLIKEMISILSGEMGINIRSFNITTNNDLFEGQVTLYVSDIDQLNNIIKELQKVEGVNKIYRID